MDLDKVRFLAYSFFSLRAFFLHEKRGNDRGDFLLSPHREMLKGASDDRLWYINRLLYVISFALCCAVTAVLLVVDIPLLIVKDGGGALKGKISAFFSKEKVPEAQPLLKHERLPSGGLQANCEKSELPQQRGGEKGTSVEFRSSSSSPKDERPGNQQR
jgi:hypothetical protein